MKLVAHEFVKSERRKCFNESDVAYLKRLGYEESTRKDNFVYMVKPVRAYITVETDGGVRVKQDMRDQIVAYYNLERLRVERFNMFLTEVFSGEAKLAVTQDGELVIAG